MVIRAHAEFALAAPKCPPEVGVELDELLSAVVEASGLTSQLLAFGREQPHTPEPVQVGTAVTDVLRLLRRALPETLHVELSTIEDGCAAVDVGQLQQVVSNLCLNARDAVGGEGRVEIVVDRAAVRSRQWMRIDVSNDGPGMSAHTQSRIFEPFFTTKPPEKGSGLGLTVVKSIVDQHGGFVEIESEPGSGCVFRIYLPEVALETTDGVPDANDGPYVVVADDDERVRSLMARILRAAGLNVAEAGDGQQALDILTRDEFEVKGAVVDAVMPGMSGPETCAAIQAMRPGLPVLVTSGHGRTGELGEFLRRTGTPFLRKPFAREELVMAVARAMAGVQQG